MKGGLYLSWVWVDDGRRKMKSRKKKKSNVPSLVPRDPPYFFNDPVLSERQQKRKEKVITLSKICLSFLSLYSLHDRAHCTKPIATTPEAIDRHKLRLQHTCYLHVDIYCNRYYHQQKDISTRLYITTKWICHQFNHKTQ